MNYRKNNGSKILSGIFAVLLVLVIAAGVIGVGYMSNWFTDWTKFEQEQPADEEQGGEETANGGAVISGSVENGVSLMSAKIATADYSANDISPLAETAYTLTATITPADAANKTVDWSVEFVNPSSSWANGKTVTDYVTVTPTGDGAATATVQCLAAFGEQIKVTATSVDNSEKSASCTVDYAQKVTGVSVSIGDIDFVENGNTEYYFELAQGVRGSGGEISLDYETSSVYTIADEFTWDFDDSCYDIDVLSQIGNMFSDLEIDYFNLGYALENASTNVGSEFYFDCYDNDELCTFGNSVAFTRSINSQIDIRTFVEVASTPFAPVRAETLDEIFGHTFDGRVGVEHDIQFTLSGKHSSYTYKTTLKMVGYTYNSTITDVSLDKGSIIF